MLFYQRAEPPEVELQHAQFAARALAGLEPSPPASAPSPVPAAAATAEPVKEARDEKEKPEEVEDEHGAEKKRRVG